MVLSQSLKFKWMIKMTTTTTTMLLKYNQKPIYIYIYIYKTKTFSILLLWTKEMSLDVKNQICAKKKNTFADLRIPVPGFEWTDFYLTVWSELALRSMRPSSRKVRTSVAPEWAWKHPTQVKLGTDQTLISPDTEPEHIVDEDEKERLRTDDLWPQKDWKQHSFSITIYSGNSSFYAQSIT